MFAIRPTNRFYKTNRYVGVRSDTKLPYLVYEGNSDFPGSIHDFGTLEAAVSYLTKTIVNRDDIDIASLSPSQMVDLSLVNNANKFDIIEYSIQNNTLEIINTFPQPQFSRKDWY